MTTLNTGYYYGNARYAGLTGGSVAGSVSVKARNTSVAASVVDTVALSNGTPAQRSTYSPSVVATNVVSQNVASNAGTAAQSSGETDSQGIFSTGNLSLSDNFANLSRLLGLSGAATDLSSFIKELDESIADEQAWLQSEVDGLLKKAGLSEETKKITFAEDAEGNIVVLGNLRADKKKELERLVNGNTELVERMKTQKAKMEIAAEVRFSVQGGEDSASIIKKIANPGEQTSDLASDSLAAARSHLIDTFLKDNTGASLSQVATKQDAETGEARVLLRDAEGRAIDNGAFQSLLGGFPALKNELIRHAKTSNEKSVTDMTPRAIGVGEAAVSSGSGDVRALMTFKRGELTEAENEESALTEEDFKNWAQKVRGYLTREEGAVSIYNRDFANHDPDLEIVDFSVRVDSNGNVQIENVITRGGDEKDNFRAQGMLNKMADEEFLKEATAFGEALFNYHDDEHGDVAEFKHFAVIGNSGGHGVNYQIYSPEADKTALKELESIADEAAAALTSLFGSSGVESPFQIHWDGEQLTLLDGLGLLSDMETKKIGGILKTLNERLVSDDPLNDSLFDDKLSLEMAEVLDKLFQLKETRDKIHDPTLKNLGVTFTVNGR